jgi:hypothetical protein
MRLATLTLAVCGVLWPCGDLFAQDRNDKKGSRHPGVKPFDFGELETKSAPKGSTPYKPREIDSAEEVDKIFPKRTAESIKKQVDFKKERLVYFTWLGQTRDTISPTVGSSDGPVVQFTYTPAKGEGRDSPQRRMYVVSKNLKWQPPKKRD